MELTHTAARSGRLSSFLRRELNMAKTEEELRGLLLRLWEEVRGQEDQE